MRTRKMRRVTARYKWDNMKVSFWFAPAVMSLGAILLAWIMYWVDCASPMKCWKTAISSCLAVSVSCVLC